MWDITQRATNNNANKLIDTDNAMVVTRQKGGLELEAGKRGPIYGDRKRQLWVVIT